MRSASRAGPIATSGEAEKPIKKQVSIVAYNVRNMWVSLSDNVYNEIWGEVIGKIYVIGNLNKQRSYRYIRSQESQHIRITNIELMLLR